MHCVCDDNIEQIQQVLSSRKIFLFGELLEVSTIQALRGSEFEKSLDTLELFAHGRFDDYRTSMDKFIELTMGQENKLRQLTIVTLAEEDKVLSYEKLQQALYIDNVRQLEDLIIESIYSVRDSLNIVIRVLARGAICLDCLSAFF